LKRRRGTTGKESRDKPREMANDTVPGDFKYKKRRKEFKTFK
jgi:hypothetical protein